MPLDKGIALSKDLFVQAMTTVFFYEETIGSYIERCDNEVLAQPVNHQPQIVQNTDQAIEYLMNIRNKRIVKATPAAKTNQIDLFA